jgi:DNA adenine methylase
MLNRYSPLRYPGGKGRLTNFMQRVFEINKLNDGEYAEPFAGGAAIGLGLLFHENASKIHINDIDRSIYAFWHCVLNDTERFCRKISSTRVSVAQWKRQKIIQKSKSDCDLFELGFSTFFLNRTNRSGIINGGIIGGYAQAGEWGIDARFNKSELIKRIEAIASYQRRIKIYNLDAKQFLFELLENVKTKALVYLDPPYFKMGNRLYMSHFKEGDHAELGGWIQDNLRLPWVMTYDNVPQIADIYAANPQIEFSISYSARRAYRGSELMIHSKSLELPSKQELELTI